MSIGPSGDRALICGLPIIQALAYGVYARDATQYQERIKAFRLK